MSEPFFVGTATAIITPFNENGSIDFRTFKKLIEEQISNGIEAIVVCGSTGEGATLSNKEKISLITSAVEYANGRVKIISGTGSNNTQQTIDLTIIAKEHGSDAVLIVAPYYNKPNQEGIFRHFKAIADLVNIPLIIYNVPSRTGINITAETQIRIANECINVVGTKEASGNLEQMAHIIQNAPSHFYLYSGDDVLTLPAISIGAKGVISVISNYAPKQFGDMVRFALQQNFAEARIIHYGLLELMSMNFVDTNPAPVKSIMKLLGMCEDYLRLPLVQISNEHKVKLVNSLKNSGFTVKRSAKP